MKISQMIGEAEIQISSKNKILEQSSDSPKGEIDPDYSAQKSSSILQDISMLKKEIYGEF